MASMAHQPTPDTKDWTWVLERPCPECGFEPAAVDREEVAEMIRVDAERWNTVLRRPDAAERPNAHTWSPLEYGCHVRDVHRLFGERLQLMLSQDDPQFANWDQDATAIAADYSSQDPVTVAGELRVAARAVAAAYLSVHGVDWARPGRRSNGSVFTVESLARYHLHDDVHHLWDVRG